MSNNGLDQRSIAKWEAEQADPNHNPIPENNGRAEMGGHLALVIYVFFYPFVIGWHFSKWIIRHSGSYITGIMFFVYHQTCLLYFWYRSTSSPGKPGWDLFDPYFTIIEDFTNGFPWHELMFYFWVSVILFVYTLVRWAFKSPEKKAIISQKNLADKEKYNSVANRILGNPFIWCYLSYKLAAPSKN